jgi:hypothetical protein
MDDKIIGSGNKSAFEKGNFLNRETYLLSISNIVTLAINVFFYKISLALSVFKPLAAGSFL